MVRIFTEHRTYDWIAYLETKNKWEAGRTEEEVIGKLVITRQKELDIQVISNINKN